MKYILCLCLTAAIVSPAASQGETFTGKIFAAAGTVKYLKDGTATWLPVKVPQLIEVGDKVKTGPGSQAELYIKYGSKIRLGADAIFVLNNVGPKENSVEILLGKMQAWIRKTAGRKFTVRTPSAVCAVRGTVFEVDVDPSGQTVWNLFSGVIRVSDSHNNTVTLAPNQRVAVSKEKGVDRPISIPAGVIPPEEPAIIKEERAEAKAEQAVEQQVVEQVKAVAEEPPPTTVIETQVVQESLEVSGSTP
jgi:hypothetical protein